MQCEKKYLNLIIILVIILLNHSSLFAKKKSDKEIQTYPYEWSFQQDTEPLQTEVVGNPLDYAGRRNRNRLYEILSFREHMKIPTGLPAGSLL